MTLELQRNTVNAQELNRENGGTAATDPTYAEALLREALGVDLFFGKPPSERGSARYRRVVRQPISGWPSSELRRQNV